MKKRIMALVLVSVLVLSAAFTGCSSQTEEENPQNSSQSSQAEEPESSSEAEEPASEDDLRRTMPPLPGICRPPVCPMPLRRHRPPANRRQRGLPGPL